MKPSWDDAPDWANWLALDPDGSWFWFEIEPVWDTRWDNMKGRYEYAGSQPSSYESLEGRP